MLSPSPNHYHSTTKQPLQVLISIPARPDLPPVAGTFLTTACFSTVILLNDTLRMWESAADIPPSPTLDPVPAVDQAALFNVGPGCGGGAPTVAVLSSHRGEPEGTLVEQSVQMPADDSSSGGSSLSAGAIAGIVIGSVAGAAVLALLAVFLIRRRGRGRAPAARDEAWGDAASAKGGLTDHSDALSEQWAWGRWKGRTGGFRGPPWDQVHAHWSAGSASRPSLCASGAMVRGGALPPVCAADRCDLRSPPTRPLPLTPVLPSVVPTRSLLRQAVAVQLGDAAEHPLWGLRLQPGFAAGVQPDVRPRLRGAGDPGGGTIWQGVCWADRATRAGGHQVR